MKTVDKEEAFARSLPKWPQLAVTGQPLTTDQAKEIIFKTDRFVTGLSEHGGGNNRSWISKFFNDSGLGFLGSLGLRERFLAVDRLRLHLGFIGLDFLSTDWASSCYIHGPHGWCAPTGEICYVDNVGKYPSVQELYSEIERLGAEFPYLCLTATAMSGESCEESQPVVTFVLDSGSLVMTDEHEDHHYPVNKPERPDLPLSLFLHVAEEGLPEQWTTEYAARIRAAVNYLELDRFTNEASK